MAENLPQNRTGRFSVKSEKGVYLFRGQCQEENEIFLIFFLPPH